MKKKNPQQEANRMIARRDQRIPPTSRGENSPAPRPRLFETDTMDDEKRTAIVDVMKALENFAVDNSWPITALEIQPLVHTLGKVGLMSRSIEAAMRTMDPDKQQQYLVLGYQGGYEWEGGEGKVGALKGLRGIFSR